MTRLSIIVPVYNGARFLGTCIEAILREMSDERELTTMGLLDGYRVLDSRVYRVPKAYPVYDAAYAESLACVREYVDALPGVWTIGRAGLHRYNNQDHSMLTARYAVRNLLFGEGHDIWGVNTEEEYLEKDSYRME